MQCPLHNFQSNMPAYVYAHTNTYIYIYIAGSSRGENCCRHGRSESTTSGIRLLRYDCRDPFRPREAHVRHTNSGHGRKHSPSAFPVAHDIVARHFGCIEKPFFGLWRRLASLCLHAPSDTTWSLPWLFFFYFFFWGGEEKERKELVSLLFCWLAARQEAKPSRHCFSTLSLRARARALFSLYSLNKDACWRFMFRRPQEGCTSTPPRCSFLRRYAPSRLR